MWSRLFADSPCSGTLQSTEGHQQHAFDPPPWCQRHVGRVASGSFGHFLGSKTWWAFVFEQKADSRFLEFMRPLLESAVLELQFGETFSLSLCLLCGGAMSLKSSVRPYLVSPSS